VGEQGTSREGAGQLPALLLEIRARHPTNYYLPLLGIKGMRERACALGATLQIESEPATGTRVRFELTLREDAEEPEKKVRILLVEDHSTDRQALAASFDREEASRARVRRAPWKRPVGRSRRRRSGWT